MEPRDFLIGGGIVGALGVGCCLFIAIPNFLEMQVRAKRAEVPANISGLKTAEMAYAAAFDEFVDCTVPTPRPVEALDDELYAWGQQRCFDELGWMPDGDVRGTYWIDVNAEGTDFTVHGMADLDEDGVPCHYTATRSINATAVTDPDVY